MAARRGDDDEAWALPRKRDRYGFRSPRIHSPDLMRDIGDRLESLGGGRETPAARAYVDSVVRSPYWGLRVLAIRVLGQWGGKANKAWLMEKAARPTSPGWPREPDLRWRDLETMTARAALRPLLKPEDAEWFLDAWFDDGGRRCYAMGTGLAIVGVGELADRLEVEIAADDPGRRVAALLMIHARSDLPDRAGMISRLANDGQADVRGFAQALQRQFAIMDAASASSAEPAASQKTQRREKPPVGARPYARRR